MKERCFYLLLLVTMFSAIAFPASNVMAKKLEGLVLYLPFEEVKPPVDYSPDAAEIAVKGNLKQVKGKFGNAAEFDGASFVEVKHKDKLEGMDNLTIEVWINPVKTTDASIVSKRVANTVQDVYNFFLYTGSKLSGRINASGDFWSKTVFEAGKWYHIAYVFEGGKKQEIYVNGSLDASGASPAKSVGIGGASLWVGELDSVRGFQYKGVMDELGIWNIAFSEDKIKSVMEQWKLKMMPVEPQGKLTTTWAEVKMR